MLPSLFIAHGAPLLAIQDNQYTRFLQEYGQNAPRPRAIILFSAHWESDVQQLSDIEHYSTMYDFGGFPDALYQIQYPANGDHELTQEIGNLLAEEQIPFHLESKRGLDHGAWVVLRMLYPNADVPVIAMSINRHLTPAEQYQIGKAIGLLRARDVLIIGSGGTVHNLRAVNFHAAKGQVDDWASHFDEWLGEHLEKWDTEALFNYDSICPTARFAVPPHGNEHFVPLFYAMGAADDSQKAKLLHQSYQYANLSHTVWQFG
jgi:4,5-DOPA dioxygenase extradiol